MLFAQKSVPHPINASLYKYPLKILPTAKIHKGTAIVKGTPGVLTSDLRALLGA
jgi:hypothetical protein